MTVFSTETIPWLFCSLREDIIYSCPFGTLEGLDPKISHTGRVCGYSSIFIQYTSIYKKQGPKDKEE